MRFSYAIMNPPYDRNLHLKFLEKVIGVADKVVNISPVRWLQDPFAPYVKGSDLLKFEDSVAKKIESLEILPAKSASYAFNTDFVMNVGIYTCSDKGGYDYKHTDHLVQKIVNKTLESSWEPFNQKDFYKRDCKQEKPFVLNFCGFGGSGKSDLYIITCLSYESQLQTTLTNKTSVFTGGIGKSASHFEFDTEEERHNFYDCYNTLFMKWTYHLWKNDVNVKTYKVPYFGDYTKPWTNERFCEYFGITGFISDTEAELGSEWETILHCINNLNKQDNI